MRVWLDVAIAKPGPLPPQTITLAGRLRHELDHVDALLESFLTLARTQSPAVDQATLSLGGIASAAIERRAGAISQMALSVGRQGSAHARVTGSETLLCRMVENVIDNAVRHNDAGGWVRVSTEAGGSLARIVVENGGTVLTQEDVGQLTQPFRRPGAERTGSDKSTGLGLSIVKSIAEAHGDRLNLHARPDGGLRPSARRPRPSVLARR
jgi:signal transduction histidine kinase